MAGPASDEAHEDERRMPFSAHLGELRVRLRNIVIGVLVGTGVAWLIRAPLFALMAHPLWHAWEDVAKSAGLGDPSMFFNNPMDPFMVFFKLSFMGGIFLSSPVIFHQLWKFISPGLYAREKRIALPFILVSVLLFIGGAAFCYVFVLPKSFQYFLNFSSDSMGIINNLFGKHEVWGHKVDVHLTTTFTLKPMLTIDEYFGLTSMLLLAFGAAFELPLVLAVLAMLGIVSPKSLWRFNRYWILLSFIAGAILTPGDMVLATVAMGGALTVLYNLSILVAVVVGRKKRREAAVTGDVVESHPTTG